MRLFFKNLFTTLFAVAVLSSVCLVEGRTIPARPETPRRRSASPEAVEVSGLDVLKTDTTSVNVPISAIPELVVEIIEILVATQKIMKAKGISIPTTIATPTAAAGRRRGDPAEVGALPVLKTYVCPACSNTVKRQNTDYITNILNASTDDLVPLYQQLLALLQQLLAIIKAEGIAMDPSGTSLSALALMTAVSDGRSTTVSTSAPTAAVSDGSLSTAGPNYCAAASTVYQTTFIPAPTAATGSVAAGSTATPTASVAASSTTDSSGPGGIFIATVSDGPGFPKKLPASTVNYVFNAQSTKNVAVYFGQTPITGSSSLRAQCSDANVDIVILAFVIARDFGGKYPQVNFGAACGGQTPAMLSQAPGLLWCPDLAADILSCQQTYGKKVFLSIGGSTSQITFSSQADAADFGNILWDIFGPPGNIDKDLRPFGNVTIDGFDVDNENNIPGNYQVLASTLRAAYLTDASKTYYLSSAPQCPFPDASNPEPMIMLCDFVFVQFYNNPFCEIGSAGFNASVHQWSTAIAGSSRNPKPRIYVGAPSWSLAGPSAYGHIGTAKGMQSVAKSVQSMGLDNFGGVMFWDGPEGQANDAGGSDIISWAKAGLEG